MRVGCRVNLVLDSRVIGVAVPVFTKYSSPCSSLDDELLRPHKLLLEVGVPIFDAHSIHGSIAVDKDVVIVERCPGSVRHDPIIRAIDLGRNLSSDHAVVDFGLKSVLGSAEKKVITDAVRIGALRQTCMVLRDP